jgi:hypothetical protein
MGDASDTTALPPYHKRETSRNYAHAARIGSIAFRQGGNCKCLVRTHLRLITHLATDQPQLGAHQVPPIILGAKHRTFRYKENKMHMLIRFYVANSTEDAFSRVIPPTYEPDSTVNALTTQHADNGRPEINEIIYENFEGSTLMKLLSVGHGLGLRVGRIDKWSVYLTAHDLFCAAPICDLPSMTAAQAAVVGLSVLTMANYAYAEALAQYNVTTK